MENYKYVFGNMEKELNVTGFKILDFEKKDDVYRYHMFNMLERTLSMFKYNGLTEEIPQRVLELQLQTHGYTIIFKHQGKIYASWGGLGGIPNYNYMPTIAIVNNPYLKISKRFEIDKDCVVIPNDKLYRGILPINAYYATQLTENDLSLNTLLINTRLMSIPVAKDEDTKESLDDLFKDLKTGKLTSIVDDRYMEDGIKSVPFASTTPSQTIIQLLEERQYIRGSWYNDLGIQSNYNMKRETITSNENILNVDALLPLTDSMYEMRKIGLEKVEKMFGVKIDVDFDSSWKKLRTEIKLKEQEIADQKSTQVETEEKSIQMENEKVEEKSNEDNDK